MAVESPQAPAAPAEAPRKSRAGRDLPAAIAVGVGLGAFILIPLFTYKPALIVMAAALVAWAVRELVKALEVQGLKPPLVPLMIGGPAMLLIAYAQGPDALVGTLAATVLAVFAWRALADLALDPGDRATGLRDAVAGTLVAVWVPFLLAFVVLLASAHDGAARVVALVLVAVCSDIGGYAAGALYGKHPMAPTVSPKKSWEGFAGSLALAGLVGALLISLTLHGHWWAGLLYGFAVVCTATLGDLGESLVKRDIGIKDMGSLLPGHGGLMDRLDSILVSAPVGWLVLTAFVTVH